ncbi:MAG: two-component sensor histidine kinase [Proteobacteria bacterium]|nr:MAG: two-component sensor histidine kinase [Pseudomonadota bacterium]
MTDRKTSFLNALWPRFQQNGDDRLSHYRTFQDYRQIWGMGIFILISTALIPLIVITLIYYQLSQRSIDTESLLRTERVASNARRAVTFFLEERLSALTFTANEMDYDRLTDPGRLREVLQNLKLGFGGLTDLSVIADSGTQVAYAGPFNLEGKDYSDQSWFRDCMKNNACVSEIFFGHRDVPHIVVAVKSTLPNGHGFVLRATLETERLIQTLSSYKTGEHSDIFLVNHQGMLQTPSTFYTGDAEHMTIAVPPFDERTRTKIDSDAEGRPIVVGYAYISTKIVPTSFILMVVKQKAGMMKAWLDLRRQINWFLFLSVLVLVVVVTLTSSFMVNKIFQADSEKAKTMAMAEQNSQLASIGQLAAGVAHEINNPLALINETAGYVKDLFALKKDYKDDPELLENIESIIEAVERCGTITRQLLGFARHFDVQSQTIHLKDMVSDVINFHKKEAEYRDIAIHVDIPDTLPQIETDRGKLQQIVLNLVNNAFQAIDNGCFLDIQARSDGDDHVRLSIRDNGCGISEANLKKIFDPFFTTKKEGQGTGLGLSITYGLVQKLHGNITVESHTGQGTTFVVTLPIKAKEETHA